MRLELPSGVSAVLPSTLEPGRGALKGPRGSRLVAVASKALERFWGKEGGSQRQEQPHLAPGKVQKASPSGCPFRNLTSLQALSSGAH